MAIRQQQDEVQAIRARGQRVRSVMSLEETAMTHPLPGTRSTPSPRAIRRRRRPHLEAGVRAVLASAYVAKLRGAKPKPSRAEADPAAFAEKVRARASRAKPPETRAKVVWILGPVLAAAAAVLLWMRAPGPTFVDDSGGVPRPRCRPPTWRASRGANLRRRRQGPRAGRSAAQERMTGSLRDRAVGSNPRARWR